MTALERDDEVPPEVALRATSSTYDRIAVAYADRAVLTPALDAHLTRFAQALPAGAAVLDVGSGPGHLAAVLAGRGLRVVALDSSAGMLELAARHVPAVRGDLGRLPVRDGGLDGVWSSASLLHVPRDEVPAVLRGWRAALRPGGLLGLSTAVGGDDEQGWEAVPYAEQAQPYGTPLRRWFVYHSRPRLEALLAGAGFQVLAAEVRVSHRDWLQVLARRTPT